MMNADIIPILLIGAFLVLILVVMPKVAENSSGWKRISEIYKVEQTRYGTQITGFFSGAYLASSMLTEFLFRGPWSIRIWASDEGIYVERPVTMFWGKPAFLPWKVLETGTKKRLFGERVALKVVGVTDSWIELSKNCYAELLKFAPQKARGFAKVGLGNQ
jgi:hypothetical protein